MDLALLPPLKLVAGVVAALPPTPSPSPRVRTTAGKQTSPTIPLRAALVRDEDVRRRISPDAAAKLFATWSPARCHHEKKHQLFTAVRADPPSRISSPPDQYADAYIAYWARPSPRWPSPAVRVAEFVAARTARLNAALVIRALTPRQRCKAALTAPRPRHRAAPSSPPPATVDAAANDASKRTPFVRW